MVISKRHMCIFVHIPKNAGTSIDRAITRSDPKVTRIDLSMPSSQVVTKGKHCFARDIRDHYGQEFWDHYLSFAVVRNPFDRLVSWYTMCVQRPDVEYRKYILSIAPTFKKFVMMLDRFDGRAKMVGYRQYDYLHDLDGTMMVNTILRFEQIPGNVNRLLRKLGVEQSIKHENVSIHSNLFQYFDRETINKVHEHFAIDFKTFGYSKIVL